MLGLSGLKCHHMCERTIKCEWFFLGCHRGNKQIISSKKTGQKVKRTLSSESGVSISFNSLATLIIDLAAVSTTVESCFLTMVSSIHISWELGRGELLLKGVLDLLGRGGIDHVLENICSH